MRPGRDLARLAILALPIVFAAGGCGSAGGSASPPAASSSATTRASPTASTPASSASTLGRPSTPPRLAVDARLLEVLPTGIDGVALEADPSTAAQIAADPTLAGSAEAIAVAIAVDPTSSSGDDLAIVSVIRLRPGVFSDAWFTIWRAAYDAAACEVAGGVGALPSETEIGGRTAFVGTCVGDAHTYHVHLADPTIVVSVTATGSRGFGELVVAGLSE